MISNKFDINKALNQETNVMKNLKVIPLLLAVTFAGVANASSTGVLNLVTKSAGIHSISYEQLATTIGSDALAGTDVSELSITRAGKPVARYISDSEADGFGPGDRIEFLAADSYTRYSDDSVHTLHLDSSLARDISVVNTGVDYTGQAATSGESFYKLQDRIKFWGSTNPNLRDPFHMGSIIASNGLTKSFDMAIESPDLTGGDVTVSVVALGGNVYDNNINVELNGTLVTKADISGLVRKSITAKVPASTLKTEGNVVTISSDEDLEAPYQSVSIESISVKYPLLASTADDSLIYKATEGVNVATGFSSDSVSVYQVSKRGIVKVDASAANANGSFGVAFSSAKGTSTYIAGENGTLTPEVKNMVVVDESINSGAAEYLIISHKQFIGAKLQELVNLRSGEYSTKVVDVDQVFAQYGLGVPSSQAIQDYIAYAASEMGTKMVLIVGGETNDPHNYRSQSVSFVPTMYVQTITGKSFNHTPSDAAYGDLDSDGIPDIAVGRLPVKTLAELDNVVSKIASYEQRGYDNVLLAVDEKDNGANYDFDKQADSIEASISGIERLSLDGANKEAAKAEFFSALENGTALTSWFGHSNGAQWSSDFLSARDFKDQLKNAGKPTVMAQFGCYNAYFADHSGMQSISDVALLNSKNGAATVLGSSSLSLAQSEAKLAKEFFDSLLNSGLTIGEAMIEAKQEIGKSNNQIDVLYGWQILGDPALRVASN